MGIHVGFVCINKILLGSFFMIFITAICTWWKDLLIQMSENAKRCHFYIYNKISCAYISYFNCRYTS